MATEKSDKDLDTGAEIQVAKHESNVDVDIHKTAIHRAKAATEKEHRMSLLTALKTYPKAVGWSMLISLCIAMEAFDLCLLNTFCKMISPCDDDSPLKTFRWPASIPRILWTGAIRRQL